MASSDIGNLRAPYFFDRTVEDWPIYLKGPLSSAIRSTGCHQASYAGVPDRRKIATFQYGVSAGRRAAAGSGGKPHPDGLGYADGISRERHAGTWHRDLYPARRRTERREFADQAELRCGGR